jgi:hypothetical protein
MRVLLMFCSNMYKILGEDKVMVDKLAPERLEAEYSLVSSWPDCQRQLECVIRHVPFAFLDICCCGCHMVCFCWRLDIVQQLAPCLSHIFLVQHPLAIA